MNTNLCSNYPQKRRNAVWQISIDITNTHPHLLHPPQFRSNRRISHHTVVLAVFKYQPPDELLLLLQVPKARQLPLHFWQNNATHTQIRILYQLTCNWRRRLATSSRCLRFTSRAFTAAFTLTRVYTSFTRLSISLTITHQLFCTASVASWTARVNIVLFTAFSSHFSLDSFYKPTTTTHNKYSTLYVSIHAIAWRYIMKSHVQGIQ